MNFQFTFTQTVLCFLLLTAFPLAYDNSARTLTQQTGRPYPRRSECHSPRNY